jgi:hypothetical protein
VARVERDDFAVSETLGLTLDEGKRLMATTQAEIVCAQVSTMGKRFRWCEHCGAKLLSKGYYPATFRSVFGDVGVRIRRLRACACRMGQPEPKSFGAVFATGGVAPELAYVTAKFAALAPFARVADLVAELLPASGARTQARYETALCESAPRWRSSPLQMHHRSSLARSLPP